MRADKKVQFVCFETALDKEPFIKRWEQYTTSSNSNADVTLQQSRDNNEFKYIAQHRFVSGELQFVFSKEARTSRLAQAHIKTTQAGGYSVLQAERLTDLNGNESKVFGFVVDVRADLTKFKELWPTSELNIYEAYYENCKYAYILEYFVKTKEAPALVAELKVHDIAETGIYHECKLTKNQKNNTAKESYVWPT
ncbi:MAG: hypothetical protein ABJA90_05230 [Ginsengibacter sp.]